MATAFKIPKQLAAAADLYYETREKRLAIQRDAAALEDQEKQLKAHIIDNLPKSQANGITGKLCRVTIVKKTLPQVEDWDKFYEYIGKNRSKGAFALLNRAVNAKAVAEIWDANKTVPGVGKFDAVTLSVNKV